KPPVTGQSQQDRDYSACCSSARAAAQTALLFIATHGVGGESPHILLGSLLGSSQNAETVLPRCAGLLPFDLCGGGADLLCKTAAVLAGAIQIPPGLLQIPS